MWPRARLFPAEQIGSSVRLLDPVTYNTRQTRTAGRRASWSRTSDRVFSKRWR